MPEQATSVFYALGNIKK